MRTAMATHTRRPRVTAAFVNISIFCSDCYDSIATNNRLRLWLAGHTRSTVDRESVKRCLTTPSSIYYTGHSSTIVANTWWITGARLLRSMYANGRLTESLIASSIRQGALIFAMSADLNGQIVCSLHSEWEIIGGFQIRWSMCSYTD